MIHIFVCLIKCYLICTRVLISLDKNCTYNGSSAAPTHCDNVLVWICDILPYKTRLCFFSSPVMLRQFCAQPSVLFAVTAPMTVQLTFGTSTVVTANSTVAHKTVPNVWCCWRAGLIRLWNVTNLFRIPNFTQI